MQLIIAEMNFAVTRMFVDDACLRLRLLLLLLLVAHLATAGAEKTVDVAATKRLVCRDAGFRFGVPGYLTCILDAMAYGDAFCLPVI
jgi:hypothetical protein